MEDSIFTRIDRARQLDADDAKDDVTGMVEQEILPRLAAAHRPERDGAIDLPRGCSNPEAVRTLAEIVVDHDLAKAEALIAARRAEGLPADQLLLDYLKPAALWLGELWERDTLNFTEVTIGVGRLQDLQHRLSEELEQTGQLTLDPRHILLSPAPGDQHTFGISMVASFMRRDGWDVAGGPAGTDAALLRRVSTESFDAVGLSIASDRWAEHLDRFIGRLRDTSRNPDLAILLGGPLLTEHPGLGLEVGADVVVEDARHAGTAARDAVTARRG